MIRCPLQVDPRRTKAISGSVHLLSQIMVWVYRAVGLRPSSDRTLGGAVQQQGQGPGLSGLQVSVDQMDRRSG